MRVWFFAGVSLGIVGLLGGWLWRDQQAEPPMIRIVSPEGGVSPKKKGVGCETGCTIKKHTIAPFKIADYRAAIAAYTKEPMAEGSPALEKLLFYGQRTRDLIKQLGLGALSAKHKAFLLRELSRTRAKVALRVVDDAGIVRSSIGPVSVPIGIKQHLRAGSLKSIQPHEFNGTVMRVGLNHLWSRY